MRIPLTRFGLPQVLIYPLLVLALALILFAVIKPKCVLLPVEIILFLVFCWMLSFFRDPLRNISFDGKLLLSPADGTITDISYADDGVPGEDGFPVRSLKIGMFLSIFNVHINRVPCDVRIEKVTYKKGQFKNAMASDAGRVNEANEVLMIRLGEPKDRLLVRQISGAIARRIVCEAREAAEYRQGEPFGMIKFGSRTELYVPVSGDSRPGGGYDVAVKIGDKVNAGVSPLVVYRP